MEAAWSLLDIREEGNRILFHRRRHELYRLVYSGQLPATQYRIPFISGSDHSLEVLYGQRYDPTLAENYCLMAYTVASHLVAYGDAREADVHCRQLLEFLDEIDESMSLRRKLEKTHLVEALTLETTSNWTKYKYKSLRISAIAGQHIHLNRRNLVCFEGHRRCLQFLEDHRHEEHYSRRLGRWAKLSGDPLFRAYELDALSDYIRCFFRRYVVDGFRIETNLIGQGFRHSACQYRDRYGSYSKTFSDSDLLPRWTDTNDKLRLMCFDDPEQIAKHVKGSWKDGFEKATDRFASQETFFGAQYLAGNVDLADICGGLDLCTAEADNLGLIGAAGHLSRLRSSIL